MNRYAVLNITTGSVIAECEALEDASYICSMYDLNPNNEFHYTVQPLAARQ